jgi:Ino eighty subunit 1
MTSPDFASGDAPPPPSSPPPFDDGMEMDNSGPAKKRARAHDDIPPLMGKLPHLKKEDGEPFWRVDIQYDFLKAIFDDDRPVFTNPYEAHLKHNFADLYIDTMSRSSKCSKVLRDKLLSDRESA